MILMTCVHLLVVGSISLCCVLLHHGFMVFIWIYIKDAGV